MIHKNYKKIFFQIFNNAVIIIIINLFTKYK